ncbi:MAG: hypothetical protein RBR02_09325 [Desulfuromonadaceae bacterium]|nr:hypothetical protein [Desulfuromonadaceae bacterium]
MAKITLEDIEERIRPAVKMIADFGGFGDDYYSVINTKYKNEMFLYDLASFIEDKKYKNIMNALKDEYSTVGVTFEKENGVISDDERLIRRSLRSFGFNDDNFHNPKFDKDDLVQWDSRPFTIGESFMDSGVNLYSLTDPKTGIEYGGRIREDELVEPTELQKIMYYKEKEMLDVHLFNKMANIENLSDKLEFIYAVLGDDEYKEEFYAYQKAAKDNLIDLTTKYNLLAMLSHDTKAPVIYKKSDIDKLEENQKINNKIWSLRGDLEYYPNDRQIEEELANLIDSHSLIDGPDLQSIKKLAIRKLKNDDTGLNIQKDINCIIADIKGSDIEESVKEKLLKNSVLGIKMSDKPLFENDVGELYGSAHYLLNKSHSEIVDKIDKLYDNSRGYIQEREILKIQRPDLEDLIKDSQLFLDGSREDMTIFRGGGLKSFGYDYSDAGLTAKSMVSGSWAELSLANDGFRREFYLAPTREHQGGANFSYCEGDLSLVVPKDKEDFEARLESGIKFYLEDDDKYSDSKLDETKKEMMDKLGIESTVPKEDLVGDYILDKDVPVDAGVDLEKLK